MTRFMTSTGQGAPAMIPGAQRRDVELLELGVIEERDEHRRHAVQGRAAFRLHRFEHRLRIEALSRIDHRGAMRDAGEVPEHHAEAVIERHRNAQAIGFREAHRLPDEETVVQDVVVRQRCTFGRAGRARRELDIDRVVELKRAPERREVGQFLRARLDEEIVEIEHARRLFVAEADDDLEVREGGRIRSSLRRNLRSPERHSRGWRGSRSP